MEMQKLMNLLDEAKIPYEIRDCFGAPQVVYPNSNPNEQVCDAVCHPGSYGYDCGLLEIMGLVDFKTVGDDVEGWLTATDVFKRIKAHYDEHSSKEKVYTYDSANEFYTMECNQNVDFIIRSLPGVTVIEEWNGLVQISVNKRAAEVIDFLSECDMVALYKNITIKQLMKIV